MDAYWDGVELTVAVDTDPRSVWDWLSDRLGALTVDQGRQGPRDGRQAELARTALAG